MSPRRFPSFFARLWDNRLTRPVKRSMVRLFAARSGLRPILNRFYGLLGDEGLSLFYSRYSMLFRDHPCRLDPGEWIVQFVDRTIRLPLRPEWSWLDWDCAVAIIGHDIEVKQTYAALLKLERPALFLDVGANYGTHSILFLSAGVATISFEPNPNCFSNFRTICELNGLKERWERVAIGSQPGELDLIYPEKETWLGSVSVDISAQLKTSRATRTERVPVKKLDEFLGDIPREGVLMKIDVEGFECEVIKGASQILKTCKPKIILESNGPKLRPELLGLLAGHGYSIHLLPWSPAAASPPLTPEEFVLSSATNFIACAP